MNFQNCAQALPRARTGLQGVGADHAQSRRKGTALRAHMNFASEPLTMASRLRIATTFGKAGSAILRGNRGCRTPVTLALETLGVTAGETALSQSPQGTARDIQASGQCPGSAEVTLTCKVVLAPQGIATESPAPITPSGPPTSFESSNASNGAMELCGLKPLRRSHSRRGGEARRVLANFCTTYNSQDHGFRLRSLPRISRIAVGQGGAHG